MQASESYEQPAQLFWNSGKPGRSLFVLVKPENAGPDLFQPIVGRGTAYADIDGDGDLDVVVTVNNGPARLFRNDGGNKNHWIRLELAGNGKTSNRDALGAKVELKSGDMVCHRQLFPAKSYLSSVEHTLTFGLGPARPGRRAHDHLAVGQSVDDILKPQTRNRARIGLTEEAGVMIRPRSRTSIESMRIVAVQASVEPSGRNAARPHVDEIRHVPQIGKLVHFIEGQRTANRRGRCV